MREKDISLKPLVAISNQQSIVGCSDIRKKISKRAGTGSRNLARFFIALLLLNIFNISLAKAEPDEFTTLQRKLAGAKTLSAQQPQSSLAILAKRFEQAVLEIKDTLIRIKEDAKNRTISTQAIASMIKEHQEVIKAIDTEVKDALEKESVQLKAEGFSAEILSRHVEFAKGYQANMDKLNSYLESVASSLDGRGIAELLDFIDRVLLPKEPNRYCVPRFRFSDFRNACFNDRV